MFGLKPATTKLLQTATSECLVALQQQVGLFGLGKDGPSEATPTAGLAKPSDDQSTEPPKAFQGKKQGENDSEQRNELTETGPSAATQVQSRLSAGSFGACIFLKAAAAQWLQLATLALCCWPCHCL